MKKVLFVCVENSNRSQMAEAFARIHGAGRVEASSAGSRPSGRVNPKAAEAMKEVGYDLTTHTSILELRAARGWSLEQTARVFQVSAATIASWGKRLDDHGPRALL